MFARVSRLLIPADVDLAPFRPGLHFAFYNALTWQIATGTPLVLLAEQLRASPAQAGLAYSFVYLLTPVQVLSTLLLPRLGYKRLTLAGWGLRGFMLVVPLALCLLAPVLGERSWMVPALIASCFGFCLLRAMGMAASTPWFFSILPEGVRGRYFGSEYLLSGVSCMVTLVACAATFAVLPVYAALFVQYLLAALGSTLSFFALRRLPDGPPPPRLGARGIGRGLGRLAFVPGPYRDFLAVSILCYAATTTYAPYAAYYLKSVAALPPKWIMAYELLRYLGTAWCAWMLRRRIDRFGARPFLALSMLLYAALAVHWVLFLRHGFGGLGGLAVAYAVMGVAGTSWMIGSLGYLPKVMSDDDRTLGLTLQGALASLVGGLSVTVWGWFLRPAGAAVVGMDPGALQAMFLVALVCCIGLGAWIARLPERGAPAEVPLAPGTLLLRPHRALAYLINLVDPRK